jgi:hypothetical protein
MSELSYEQKMRLLSLCKPEKKDMMLYRLWKGEKIDITQDEDLFFQVNKDRVSLDEFTSRDKFKASAKDFKKVKEAVDPKNMSKEGKLRHIGDIPPEIYFSRPEFSPLLDKKERDKNIRKWLNQFNAFRIGDTQL